MEALASLLAVIPLTLLARILAITLRTPVTVFLLTGIFPLVPGAGIYYSAYYFIQGDNALALAKRHLHLQDRRGAGRGHCPGAGHPPAKETVIKQNETAHRAVSLVMRENQVVGTIRSSWAPVVTSRRKYALFSSVL